MWLELRSVVKVVDSVGKERRKRGEGQICGSDEMREVELDGNLASMICK